MFIKVIYKGKRYNYHFQGENPRLIELDDKGNPMADSIIIAEEFAVDDLEQVQVFEADYVHALREEAKTNREGVAVLLKSLGIESAEGVKEFMEAHEELKKNQRGEGDSENELVEKLRGIISEKEEQLVREREESTKSLSESNEKWKSEKLSSAMKTAVAIPKAANPIEVGIILERFVSVDDEGNLTVHEDLAHTREKLGNDGKKMGLEAFAKEYYDDNPHHLIGHAGGGGGGSDALGSDKYFQSEAFLKLQPAEKLKAARKHENAKKAAAAQ